jgi:DNA-binding FadR family transcriptional regulator
MTKLYQPRLADLVADRLRNDILSGRYEEGEILDLSGVCKDFAVSTPAMREAVRVLENDGLLRTRRGGPGGAVVQLPTPHRIGEVIAMVLQARRVDPVDVSRTLAQIEPICAAMCADRSDRKSSVVPRLRRLIKTQLDELADPAAYMPNARRFHDALVDLCGSETMVVAVGALEVVWAAHASSLYARNVETATDVAPQDLRAAVVVHERIVDAIEAGDADLAARRVREHVAVTTSSRPRSTEITTVNASLIPRFGDDPQPQNRDRHGNRG